VGEPEAADLFALVDSKSRALQHHRVERHAKFSDLLIEVPEMRVFQRLRSGHFAGQPVGTEKPWLGCVAGIGVSIDLMTRVAVQRRAKRIKERIAKKNPSAAAESVSCPSCGSFEDTSLK
jgi:hypothetical protein